MRTITIYILVILFLSACGQYESNKKVAKTLDSKVTHNDTSIYTIAPFDSSMNMQSKNYKSTNLSQRDILDIDSIIHVSISEWNSEREVMFNKYYNDHPKEQKVENTMLIDITKYKRQYTPIINDKAEKEVWVYCACDGYFGPVEDGGKCYFQLKINLTKMTHTHLGINSMG